MPKYTVYGRQTIRYRAEVEAESVEALYEMELDDDQFIEFDSSPIETSSIELNGEKVG